MLLLQHGAVIGTTITNDAIDHKGVTMCSNIETPRECANLDLGSKIRHNLRSKMVKLQWIPSTGWKVQEEIPRNVEVDLLANLATSLPNAESTWR